VERLTLEEVMFLHYKAAARFGGASGLRDKAILEGALGRADSVIAYGDPTTALIDAAVAVAAGIATSHPFVDGNKRTALIVLVSTLDLNGIKFNPPIQEETDAMLALADGQWNEEQFRNWVRLRAIID
jgi:death on curing protein